MERLLVERETRYFADERALSMLFRLKHTCLVPIPLEKTKLPPRNSRVGQLCTSAVLRRYICQCMLLASCAEIVSLDKLLPWFH